MQFPYLHQYRATASVAKVVYQFPSLHSVLHSVQSHLHAAASYSSSHPRCLEGLIAETWLFPGLSVDLLVLLLISGLVNSSLCLTQVLLQLFRSALASGLHIIAVIVVNNQKCNGTEAVHFWSCCWHQLFHPVTTSVWSGHATAPMNPWWDCPSTLTDCFQCSS